MHLAAYIAAALAALAGVAFVAFRLGRAQAVHDARWQAGELAKRWAREQREPNTQRVLPRCGGLFQ